MPAISNALKERLKRAANANLARRLILQSFQDQDNDLYEPVDAINVATAISQIPQLIDKVEISPTVHAYDPRTGKCTVRWNLFVLGVNRMYLGDTKHTNISDAVMAIRSGQGLNGEIDTAGIESMYITPIKVANFISRILCKHEEGYIDWDDSTLPTYPMPPLGTSSINAVYSPGTSMYRLGLQNP